MANLHHAMACTEDECSTFCEIRKAEFARRGAVDALRPLAWLGEIVLSMEHSHNPAVRSYGDLIRKRMTEGK